MGLFLSREAALARAAAPPVASPPVGRGWRVKRWAFHALLASAFAAAGGALLVWPQWIAVDGGESTLALLKEREQELSDRLATTRAGVQQLRFWQREGRRVFLADEAARYPVLAQAVAKQEGAVITRVAVTEGRSSRWRGVTVDQRGLGEGGVAGEIRPRSVRVTVHGSFEGVYRTVASLTQQQQLFLPDRWDLASKTSGGRPEVWAEVVGTIFVVTQPDIEPAAPAVPAPSTPRAAQLARALEDQG